MQPFITPRGGTRFIEKIDEVGDFCFDKFLPLLSLHTGIYFLPNFVYIFTSSTKNIAMAPKLLNSAARLTT